jgi:uncharacterized protein YcbK (DUF882 family)
MTTDMTHAENQILPENPASFQVSRRQLMQGLGALSAFFVLPTAFVENAIASLPDTTRQLGFVNLHTGEKCSAVYWENGQYIPDALAAFNHVLRDHRSGKSHPMDAKLFDLLVTLHKGVESNASFQIISGYRAPESNAMLHAKSSGVANHSLHMEGKAVDIRLPDRSLALLRRSALAMQKGGVGYYPESNFVHVDTGRVRRW